MALLTDEPVSRLEDLQAMDSTILETAKHEGIGLDGKLRIATEHVQMEIAAFLLRTQAASVIPGGTGNYDLSRVVVTPALHRWHVLRTLVEVYSDAYNSQLNDRYLGKWKHFSVLATEVSELLFELGVGLVSMPIPRAAVPVVTNAGGNGPVEAYVVQVGWRSTQGSAGALSDAVVYRSDGELFQVSTGTAPAGASGWDVYVGTAGGEMTRQNGTPLGVNQGWLLPETGLVNGAAPTNGQTPEYHVRRSRAFF
jgi:hypothetical protein